jgi:hypothetical protein
MSEYTVTTREGCTLIQGSVPIDHFSALTKAAPTKSVMAPHLAQLAGCNFAWGPPEFVLALSTKLIAEFDAGNPNATPLQRWAAVGQRGRSSDAMAFKLYGLTPWGGEPTKAHPHDPDDLSRCIAFLGAVPGSRERIAEIADMSPQWARLVEAWPLLEQTFHAEAIGENWKAPKTYALMKSVLASAEAAA